MAVGVDLSCSLLSYHLPSTRMDPPSWELISMRHFYHSSDFKGLGSSVPGNGHKDCFFFFIPWPQLGPTPYTVYQSNKVKEEKGEASRKGSDSQTLVHSRLVWET